ncbi:MAG: signal peptidase II [Nitrospira sp.]|nr:signal peptidase II [bacterium]MBL7049085.1 signal peptidase II [Nitrospira sp.]
MAFTLIASLVIGLDYITKQMIASKVHMYQSIEVLPFLNIVHIYNEGAAFGMLQQMGNNFFIVIASLAIIFMIYYAMRLQKGMEFYAMSLIMGGAVGNLIDRIRIGKVLDFIDVFIGSWHWPAFNVADSALTVGIIMFIWSSIRVELRGRQHPPVS